MSRCGYRQYNGAVVDLASNFDETECWGKRSAAVQLANWAGGGIAPAVLPRPTYTRFHLRQAKILPVVDVESTPIQALTISAVTVPASRPWMPTSRGLPWIRAYSAK